MIKTYISFVLAFFICSSLFSQNLKLKWVSGSNCTDLAHSWGVYAAPDGGVIHFGDFRGTCDFDPGPDSLKKTSTGSDYDQFIQRLDSNGNLLWVYAFGSTAGPSIQHEMPSKLKMDAFGNIYVVGRFKGTVDFDAGVSVHNITSAGNYDAYLMKINSGGEFIWVKTFGTASFEEIHGLDIYNGTDPIISGYFVNSLDLDDGPDTLIMRTSGKEAYIARFNSDGKPLWAKYAGESGQVVLNHLVCKGNEIIVSGNMSGTVDFDFGQGEEIRIVSGGSSHAMALKVDVDGNLMWVKEFSTGAGGNATMVSHDIADNGDIYLAGHFTKTFADSGYNFAGGEFLNDGVMVKLNKFGYSQWARHVRGINNVSDGVVDVKAIPGGGALFTAYSNENSVFVGQNPNNSPVLNVFGGSFFVYMSENGDYKWSEGISELTALELDVNAKGMVYASGYITIESDFDLGPDSIGLKPKALGDFFIARYQFPLGGNVSVREIKKGNLLVYPNPTHAEIFVQVPENSNLISVLNVEGKLVFEQEVSTDSLQIINLSHLPGGIYWIKNDSGYTSKVVLIK